jgi:hypothetical protein
VTLDELIAEHCEVGLIKTNQYDAANVLACKHCGAFLWDVAKHLRSVHGIDS